jgi:phage shock protein PspC (stress-responsive transcriptional regulator)
MISAMDAPPTGPDPRTDPTGPDPSPAAPPPPPRRLARRSDERLLGGVAGGVADYLGIDVVLVRLAFVVAAFLGGVGVIAYLVGWIVLPVAPTAPGVEAAHADRRQLIGYGLVALGLLTIGGRLGWTIRGGGAFWPVLLIALGAAVLWLRTRDTHDERGPAPGGPAAPASSATATAPTPTRPMTPTPPTRPMAGTEPGAEAPTEPYTGHASTAASPTPTAPRPRSYLGPVTWSLLLVLVGAAWLLDAAGVVDLDVGVVLALALAVVGGALVVSAWWGRSRGLIALGIPLVLVVGGLGLVDVPLDGGVGSPTYRPTTIAAVHRSYQLAIGDLSLDLRRVDFTGGRRHVHAQLGIGQLNVTVPAGVRVVVHGHAGVGSVTALGRQSKECCPSSLRVDRPGVSGGGTLYLDAEVGAGNVHVMRELERKDTLSGTS